ncbi:MAG TPA: DUF6350 family protein [Trebonia sp.]|nr:DUF6350 family protein [Trebonia sp.]
MPARPMLIAGGIAALAAAAGGLAVLVTLCLIGWITAPHVGFGGGLASVLRDAGLLWLVAHHVEVSVHGVGRIGLLPLGLVLLPAALLERAGRWLTHEGHVRRLRDVGYAALSIALPYALFTAAVAVGSRTSATVPDLVQAVGWGFLLALVAGGFGAAHGLVPWRKLTGLLPLRPRSVVLGMLAALGALIALGALLDGVSLIMHMHAYQKAVSSLAPGAFGSGLLLLAELAYLPNSVIWAVAYTLGPGFAFGVGTAVSPAGSALGAIPAFPMLAALPVGSGAAYPAWLGFFVLAAPYIAGALAGLMTIRIAPTPFLEGAPLWGLLTGSLTAIVVGVLARVSGGPLGVGRLAAVGPRGGEVGLVALLEVGVTAALVAGAANWLLLRRHIRRIRRGPAEDWPPAPEERPLAPAVSTSTVVDETDNAGGHRIFIDPWAGQRDEES